MESQPTVYNLSPMCNLSEDELDAVNLSNGEFAMWDPYKEKKRAAEADERRRALGRKGRQSTILTSAKGLNEISEEEYEQKTLLG